MPVPSKIPFWYYLAIGVLTVPLLLVLWFQVYNTAASLCAATINAAWLQAYSYVAAHYPETGYTAHILSYDPLMIYVVDFVPKHERDYLLALGCVPFPPPAGPGGRVRN